MPRPDRIEQFHRENHFMTNELKSLICDESIPVERERTPIASPPSLSFV